MLLITFLHARPLQIDYRATNASDVVQALPGVFSTVDHRAPQGGALMSLQRNTEMITVKGDGRAILDCKFQEGVRGVVVGAAVSYETVIQGLT